MTAGISKCSSEGDPAISQAGASARLILGKFAALAGRTATFVALADQGIVSAANFATGVIIGRACGKPELGVYTLIWTVILLMNEISTALTTTPYTIFNPRLDKYQRSRYLGSVLVHHLALSSVFALTIGAAAALGSWRGWFPSNVSATVSVAAIVVVFIGLRDFVRRVSFAELKVGVALWVDIIACLGQIGGVLLFLHFGALTVSRTYAVVGVSSALAAGAWLTLRSKAIRPGPQLYGNDLQQNWQFAKWVLGSCVLSQFARYLFPWMLTAFHGTSATGLWAACAGIAALGNPVVLGLGNYTLPKISKVYASLGLLAMRKQVRRSSLQFALLLMPLVLITLLYGERIVTGVYGKAYSGSASVVFLLVLNALISSLMYPYSQGLFSMERAKADTLVNVVTVALLFTIGIIAVKYYSTLGAAAALVLTSIIAALIRGGVFARVIRLRTTSSTTASAVLGTTQATL